jgi:hypothetical protein
MALGMGPSTNFRADSSLHALSFASVGYVKFERRIPERAQHLHALA